MKRNRIIKRIIVGLAVVVFVSLTAVSNYLFEYAIARQGDGGNRNVKKVAQKEEASDKTIPDDKTAALKAIKDQTKEEAAAYFQENIETEDSLQTKDGLRLNLYYLNRPENKKWVLLIHGYRATHKEMYVYAKMYHQNGYNVLMPDLRASGDSEGSYIGMGALDKEDMKLALEWIVRKNSDAEIIVHGNSMGAATALLLSGEKEAERVKAFVADSGYTSVYDMFQAELNLRFGLPSFPLLDIAGVFCKLRAGYGFGEAVVTDAVAKSVRPILFVHGEKDDFVPFSMMATLFDAKTTGKKEKLISPNAGHVESIYDLGTVYEKTVMDFIR